MRTKQLEKETLKKDYLLRRDLTESEKENISVKHDINLNNKIKELKGTRHKKAISIKELLSSF